MRLRFSIRDLLWLTLMVAVGLGWFVRERQLRAEVDKSRKWRLAIGAIENALEPEGWTVALDFRSSMVQITKQRQGETYSRRISSNFAEPTAAPIDYSHPDE